MLVRARRGTRRFDEARGCYVYDVSFSSRAEPSERVRGVAEAFGLGLDERRQVLYRDFELRLGEEDVVYVTGDSRSGKSVLLHALRDDLGDRAIDIADVYVEEGVTIVDAVGVTLREALSLLSRVGLNDAYLFLRSYSELSEGQKYRFRIAKMMESGKTQALASAMIWFCATRPGSLALIVAPGLRQSMILRDKVHSLINHIPSEKRRALIRRRLRTTITFRNSSTIVALPNSENLLRGYTAHLVVCDEAAFFHNDEAIFTGVLTPCSPQPTEP